MKYILIGIAFLIVLALVLFPEFRKKLKVLTSGFLNMFVEDAAKTPDGANAVFNEAIEEARKKYQKAGDTFSRLSGELNETKNQKKILENNIKTVEAKCESCVSRGDIKNAEIFASQRSEYLLDLKRKNECLEKLTPMVAEAQQIYSVCEKNLNDLRRNKKNTVENIKLNNQLKTMYNDLDELRKDGTTSKLIESVMESSSDLEKEAQGARIVHENKISTKVANAERQIEKTQTDEYIKSLMNKYK